EAAQAAGITRPLAPRWVAALLACHDPVPALRRALRAESHRDRVRGLRDPRLEGVAVTAVLAITEVLGMLAAIREPRPAVREARGGGIAAEPQRVRLTTQRTAECRSRFAQLHRRAPARLPGQVETQRDVAAQAVDRAGDGFAVSFHTTRAASPG